MYNSDYDTVLEEISRENKRLGLDQTGYQYPEDQEEFIAVAPNDTEEE